MGLSLETMVVLLPERSYNDDELRLVLRHELIHIARRDSASKLALVSIAALCWFYPLSWFAMRRSAEDIELCCDESLLYDAGQDERRRYAELILSSAGDGAASPPAFRPARPRSATGSKASCSPPERAPARWCWALRLFYS